MYKYLFFFLISFIPVFSSAYEPFLTDDASTVKKGSTNSIFIITIFLIEVVQIPVMVQIPVPALLISTDPARSSLLLIVRLVSRLVIPMALMTTQKLVLV
jgi:hypothetical protein